jgi:hypothetical protein
LPVQLFQQRAAQRRLARADLARELDEALAFADAVEQMIERLAMLGTVEKKARVRRDVERRLIQSVEFQIHERLVAEIRPAGKEKVLRGAKSGGARLRRALDNFPRRLDQSLRFRPSADGDA